MTDQQGPAMDFDNVLNEGIIDRQEARISELKCKLSDAEKEAEEQARLLGMSAERETGFLARAEEAERWAEKLCDALMDAHETIDGEWGCCSDGEPPCDTAKLLAAWKKSRE